MSARKQVQYSGCLYVDVRHGRDNSLELTEEQVTQARKAYLEKVAPLLLVGPGRVPGLKTPPLSIKAGELGLDVPAVVSGRWKEM